MQRSSGNLHRFALTIAVGLAVGAIAPQAAGARPQTAASCHRACDDVRFSILKGFDDPATPDDLDRVGVLEVGPERARNVLVLSPGTSAGAGYFKPVPDSMVPFARGWGMNVEIQDLHRVVQAAGEHGRRVVLGGHSLGGSITTAYATW